MWLGLFGVVIAGLLFYRWYFYVSRRARLLAIPKAESVVRTSYEGLKEGEKVKVLVTGGCGALGRVVVEQLVEEHSEEIAEIEVFDAFIDSHNSRQPQQTKKGVRISYRQGDLTKLEEVVAASAGKDLVLHLAAIIDLRMKERHWPRLHNVNVVGTHNVVEACVRNGVPALVHTSSISARQASVPPSPGYRHEGEAGEANSVFEFPPEQVGRISLYGKSKNLGERAVVLANGRGCLRSACLVPGSIAGFQDRIMFDSHLPFVRANKPTPALVRSETDEKGTVSVSYSSNLARVYARLGFGLLRAASRDQLGGHSFYVTDFDMDYFAFNCRMADSLIEASAGRFPARPRHYDVMPRWLFYPLRFCINLVDWFYDGNVKADFSGPFQLPSPAIWSYCIGDLTVSNHKAQRLLGFQPVPPPQFFSEVAAQYAQLFASEQQKN